VRVEKFRKQSPGKFLVKKLPVAPTLVTDSKICRELLPRLGNYSMNQTATSTTALSLWQQNKAKLLF